MKIRPKTFATCVTLVPLTLACVALVGFSRPTRVLFDGSVSFNRWEFVHLLSQQSGGPSTTTDVTNTNGNQKPNNSFVVQNDDGSVSVGVDTEAKHPTRPDLIVLGDIGLSYRITTSDTAGTHKDIEVLFTHITKAEGSVTSYNSGSSAYVHALNTHVDVLKSVYGVGVDGDTKTYSEKIRAPQKQSIAQSGLPNYYPLNLNIYGLFAHSSTSGPVSSGSALNATAFCSATTKLYAGKSQIGSGTLKEVVRTGSAFQAQTYFKVTRSDNVAEPLNVCLRAPDGTIYFSGLDFPDTTLTIKLVQPGFLQQTQVRQVVGETLRTVSGSTVSSNTVPLSVEMVYGDADGDNDIDSNDVSIISSYVGTTSSSPGWAALVSGSSAVDGLVPIHVRDLDENQDGQITSAEVTKATTNVGRTL